MSDILKKSSKSIKEVNKRDDTAENKYFEENMLHGIIISNMKECDKAISELEKFLPYVDNWAVCDTISPKVFKKNREKIITKILLWIKSDHTYICRFGIGMIMQLYLEDEYFKTSYLDIVAKIRIEDYYINMMRAWTFQGVLVKQWKEAIVYIEKELLDKFTHNKTISKSCESYRIDKEKKEYLSSLKR